MLDIFRSAKPDDIDGLWIEYRHNDQVALSFRGRESQHPHPLESALCLDLQHITTIIIMETVMARGWQNISDIVLFQ
jgi:hypothetical protein